MRICPLLALAGSVISLTLTSFAQQAVEPQTAEQIRVLATKFDQAFNKNDAVAVAALYTEAGLNAFHTTFTVAKRSKNRMRTISSGGVP
jgi:hypothetical protein